MKRIIGTGLVLLVISSVGFASPLNDFSQGKVAIDVSVRPDPTLKASESALAWPKIFDGQNYTEYDIAVGLGNNFAFQYHQASPEADYTENINGTLASHSGKLITQEFNVIRKIDDNYSVFTGIKQVKEKIYDGGKVYKGDPETNWQFGVTGQAKLGKNLDGYATIAAGKDSSAWKVGMSYAIDKNIDCNIFYAENKYNKVTHNSIIGYYNNDKDADYTVKGMGYGITFKL